MHREQAGHAGKFQDPPWLQLRTVSITSPPPVADRTVINAVGREQPAPSGPRLGSPPWGSLRRVAGRGAIGKWSGGSESGCVRGARTAPCEVKQMPNLIGGTAELREPGGFARRHADQRRVPARGAEEDYLARQSRRKPPAGTPSPPCRAHLASPARAAQPGGAEAAAPAVAAADKLRDAASAATTRPATAREAP